MRFKISMDDKINEELLKRKTCEFTPDNECDNAYLFEQLMWHFEQNDEKYFNLLSSEEYFDFTVTKGKIWQKYTASYDYCDRCGGYLEIWLGDNNYEEEE